MEYLVIYDVTGKLYYMASGDVIAPHGLPYLMVTVPQNKIIKSIDVSGETPTPIFEDLPKSETVLLQEQVAALQEELSLLNDVLLEQMGI